MYKSSKLTVLIVTLVLLQCLIEIDCRRTTSSSRRGSSRGKNYGSYGNSQTSQTSASGGWFSSWFGGSSTKAVSSSAAVKPSSTGTSTGTKTATNYGWSNPSNTQVKPAQTNPAYGWSIPGQAAKPGQVATNNKNPSYGWTAPNNKKPDVGNTNNPFQNKANTNPSANIGPRGYPVQPGMQTSGHQGYNTGGYNTGYRPNTYNSGFQQSHNYNPGHTSGFGGHNSYQPNSFSSHHGFTPNYYPSHNSFGYPGQGVFGGSNVKYGGMGLFGGSSGHYGYPGSGSWGQPSYGTGMLGRSSGRGNLLTGLALGAAGGYLTSSLVHRISNPWGYGGYGYGQGYGYERGHYGRYDPYRPTAAPPASAPNPADSWVSCIAFDPTTNQTLINPNCTCSVTTSLDPMTNQPVSVHNCTTANGLVLPPMGPNTPVVPLPNNYGMPAQNVPYDPQQPFSGINTPGVVPQYSGSYLETQRYGAPLETGVPTFQNSNIDAGGTATPSISSNTTATENTTQADSPESMKQTAEYHDNRRKVAEFYSKLEKMVDMGKFN